jgi:hypothetical protein
MYTTSIYVENNLFPIKKKYETFVIGKHISHLIDISNIKDSK